MPVYDFTNPADRLRHALDCISKTRQQRLALARSLGSEAARETYRDHVKARYGIEAARDLVEDLKRCKGSA